MSGIIAQNSGRHTGLVKASSGGGGVWNLILTQTASSSAALSFTSGLDSTYDEYIFTFINLHPETDDRGLMVGFRDGSTDYDAIKTTSKWRAYHAEADDAAVLSYDSDYDQHQATGFQQFDDDIGNDNDQSLSGYMHLFAPSDTTFTKHFTAETQSIRANNYTVHTFMAGYCNTTTAIDGVQFKMRTGNMDSGQISLFGIS